MFISRIASDQTLVLARTVLIINLNLEFDYGGDKRPGDVLIWVFPKHLYLKGQVGHDRREGLLIFAL